MCSADLKRAIGATHILIPEGIPPGLNRAGLMNQDAGGGGLMEPSTDAPADSEFSMPAGLGWTAPFSE